MTLSAELKARCKELCRAGLNFSEITKMIRREAPGVKKLYDKVRSCCEKEKVEVETSKKVETTYNVDGSRGYERIIELANGENSTPDELMMAHGLDPKQWVLVSAKNNWWGTQKRGGEVLPLFQSKITVRPYRVDEFPHQAFIEYFKEFESGYKPPKVNYTKKKRSELLEVSPFDTHLGKLGWEPESGENYDHKIAGECLLHVVEDVISRVKNRPIAKIIYPNIGNDFFHFDNPQSTTTGGTQQDADIRWQKMQFYGYELQVKVIEILSTIAPVEAIYIPSNHDLQNAYNLALSLYAHFKGYNNVDVDIDISPSYRKYRAWGNVLIGYSHGDWDAARLHSVMPVEAPELWGKSLYREMHVGHLHCEKAARNKKLDINEEGGVIVRHLSSISAADAWHAKNGYIGAVRKSMNFIYDKEKGLTDILNSVV